MKTFFPGTGSEAEWNAAYYRLEDYLRALRVANKVHRSQIILQLLERAAQRHTTDPSQSPITLALEEAYRAMDQWFEAVLEHPEQASVTGRVSLFLSDAHEKWPTVFLSDDVPLAVCEAMKESEVRAGPDLQVSSMVPRAFDVSPVLDAIQDRWEKLDRRIVGPAFAVIGLIIGLFCFAIAH